VVLQSCGPAGSDLYCVHYEQTVQFPQPPSQNKLMEDLPRAMDVDNISCNLAWRLLKWEQGPATQLEGATTQPASSIQLDLQVVQALASAPPPDDAPESGLMDLYDPVARATETYLALDDLSEQHPVSYAAASSDPLPLAPVISSWDRVVQLAGRAMIPPPPNHPGHKDDVVYWAPSR